MITHTRRCAARTLCAAAGLLAITTATTVQADSIWADLRKPVADVFQVADDAAVDRIAMNALDVVALSAEDEQREALGAAPRYAVPGPVAMSPATDGTWTRLPNGQAMWRLRISNPNAKSINLGFTEYFMPDSGRLMVHATDRTMHVRPFTARDNAAHGELWTPPVPGNDIMVEVVLDQKDRGALKLTLSSINLGYRGFYDQEELLSGACNNDVVCPEGDPWADEIPSVGVISTGGSTFCTGFMVNNVRQDLTPYFMTADHCGIGAGNAASLVVFWNYQTTTCGGPRDGQLNQFQTGSFFRAAYGPSDMTLVELDEDPDEAFGVTFSGWDATGAEAQQAIAIHHPSTDEKAISFEFQPTTTTTYLETSVPGNGTHHRVEDWDDGTTEPGSSGSPLYNQDHRVIGQLHGGFASCTSQTADWYGKWSVSWTGGGTTATSLKPWLDPDDTGTLVLDTITGAGLSVSPQGEVEHLGQVGGPFTNDPIVFDLTNNGPDSINYDITLGAGTAPILIDGGSSASGSLAGEGMTTATISLDNPAALAAGVYTREVNYNDLTNARTTTINHTVEVGTVGFTTTPEDNLTAGGPVGGPFTATQMYTLTSTKPTPITVEVSASDNWISINGGTAPVQVTLTGIGDSANVTIGYSSNADSLAAGIYDGSVDFTSLSGGSDDTSRDVTLDVGRFTYVSADTPLSIPDSGQVTSTITVPDQYCIGDVNLEVQVNHTYVGDLRMTLAHDGVPVIVYERPSGCSENNFDIVLDDEGTGAVIDTLCAADLASPPSYQPSNALSAFDGLFSQGDWTLTISDNAGADTGDLVTWTLKIASSGDICPPTADNVDVTIPVAAPANITLLGASANKDHDFVITSLPSNGALADPNGGSINTVPYTLIAMGNQVTYDPFGSSSFVDSFTFKTNDGQDSNEATVTITVGGPQPIYSFPFDSDPGWATTGDWDFGPPNGTDGDPTAGFTGANCYGYNHSGEYPNNMSEETLTSTALDCTNLTQTSVSFQRWLGVEHASFDHARFQVSTDNVSYTTIWENLSGFSNTLNESAWSFHEYDISAIADGEPTLYLRWVMGTTDGSVTFHGWNIDDVVVSAIEDVVITCPWDCEPPGGNGTVNFDDLVAVLNGISTQDLACDVAPDNGDGTFGNGSINFDDIIAVVNNFGDCISK